MMLKHSITALATICFVSVLSSTVIAQTGVVFAGRVVKDDPKMPGKEVTPVTFVGSEEGGLLAGRLVIGGIFVTGDVEGYIFESQNGVFVSLTVYAFDAETQTNWRLTARFDGFFTISGVSPDAGNSFSGTGRNAVVNIH